MGTILSVPSHPPLGKGRKELRALFSSSGRLGVAIVGAGFGEQGEKVSPLSVQFFSLSWRSVAQATAESTWVSGR